MILPKLISRLARASLIVAFACVSSHAATYQISIEDYVFIPDQIIIGVGDTVEWVANASEHSVTSDDGVFDSQTVWDAIPIFQSFSYTFSEPGSYRYFCVFHGGQNGSGMSGTVYVSETFENSAPARPVNLSPIHGATNQPASARLQSSAFSDPDPGDFHAASQWVVRRVSNNQIVFDSGEDTANKTNRIVPNGWLSALTEYSWRVRHQDGRGAWSDYSLPTTFRTLQPVLENGIGLKASYYNFPNFTVPLAISTNATVSFDWGQARPHRRITADAFAIRWDGFLLPQFDERYEFQFQYRGLARVWVNNQLLIDEGASCSFTQTRRSSIVLAAGQLVALRVEYGADAAGAMAILRWTSPSQPLQTIPTNRLFPGNP